MNDIDGMLARLAAVGSPHPLGADPAFVARLDASARQGAIRGLARSAAMGVAAAAVMVAIHVGTIAGSGGAGGGGPLLTTSRGIVL